MASSGTYLNLTLPDVGSTLGPTWATTLNNAFIDLDDHDHSTQGKSIPSAGLNINADVEINDNSLTEVKSVVLQSQSTNLTVSGNLFNRSNELFYYNGTSVAQITDSGGLSGAKINSFNFSQASSSTTVTLTDANAGVYYHTGTATQINLPAANSVTAGRFYFIKVLTSSTVAITPNGTDTIDGGTGGTAVNLSGAYSHIWVVSDGSSKWLRMQN